ncbi:thioredoxin domain-containing protein [Halopiger aswanensis]|uniref:Protein-disulfide isomerase n=1 Tax=Halopiger aswanensis TaxID=148449 RepID=A0A419WQS9_9EURY|nr:thioredoxin domain-containing protein [Halopiger aswanensis]RKD97768.1 protein-disulfide isomerase [Halopiger aswanensis]
MHRRSFLAATAGTAAVGLAGCTSFLEASIPSELEDVDADRQLPVPTLGDGDVPVTVYEDLGCPHCQEFQADVFPTLESDYIEPGEIEYRHRDFVVMASESSAARANAARAVQAATQTDDDPNGRFFEYKRTVMRDDIGSADELAAAAEDVGVDPSTVTEALEDDTYYPTLVADWEHGEAEGVEATPTVFVDGEPVDDSQDGESVVAAIEDALGR